MEKKETILLLLRTGMRIGELLEVQISDISFAERKIMIYLGEKNFQGRAVHYSEDAEQALKKWLKIRPCDSTYLFPGRSIQSKNMFQIIVKKCFKDIWPKKDSILIKQ